MTKVKSKTVTDEYDEQGRMVSHWESTEYHPEPEEPTFHDGSDPEGVVRQGSVKHLALGQADYGYVLGLPSKSRCSGNCSSHGSLRS